MSSAVHRLVALAAFAVIFVSSVWGFRVLTDEVDGVGFEAEGSMVDCGSVLHSLRGSPRFGGELPYPDDWTERCRDGAREQVTVALIPAATGLLGVVVFLGSIATLNRRAVRARPDVWH